MPMTKKGKKIMKSMKKEYGSKKGEEVFYASANKGTISGVHKKRKHTVERAGNTEYTLSRNTPATLSTKVVDDLMDGFDPKVLSNDTKYTVVPGTDNSQVRIVGVKIGNKVPRGY